MSSIVNPQDDSELVRRSKDGDLASFNQLVLGYQQRTYNLVLRMLGNRQQAEDCTQEAFLSAWKNIRNFRGDNFRAWLFSIAANGARDMLRWKKRHQSDSLDAFETLPPDPRHSDSPDEYVERREVAAQIGKGLSLLPQDQRLAVTLRDIQGLEYDEIAKVMGCNLGTVKSRISRARAQLRDYLVKSGTISPGPTS